MIIGKKHCATYGVKMQITLYIYETGFEPQVWHEAEFLQNNFVRFFSPVYLLTGLSISILSISISMGMRQV